MGYGHSISQAGLTVSTAVVDLTDGSVTLAAARVLHVGLNRAQISVISQPIRYTLDGTTPSATVGLRAAAGETIHLYGKKQLDGFQCIREGGTDAELEIAYFAD